MNRGDVPQRRRDIVMILAYQLVRASARSCQPDGWQSRQRRHRDQQTESGQGGVPARPTSHLHMTIMGAESGMGAKTAYQRDSSRACRIGAAYYHLSVTLRMNRAPLVAPQFTEPL